MFVLLIGDKGGGTFKLTLQDLSRTKPNSPMNGIMIGEMNSNDSYENLRLAFAPIAVCFLNLKQNKKIKNKNKNQNLIRKKSKIFKTKNLCTRERKKY